MKKYRTENNRWRLQSGGNEADVDQRLLERAESLAKKSRVTYVEANLLRHIRKSGGGGQVEANACYEYLVKYPEVAKDQVLPWLSGKVLELFKKWHPLVKTDHGLQKVGVVPWL